ncbi:MAG: hypothetical protein R2849_17470 [Thermomicrobiales bacterium]
MGRAWRMLTVFLMLAGLVALGPISLRQPVPLVPGRPETVPKQR